MKALFFAYYFPPMGGIGSLRAASLARYLPGAGVETTVIAPRTGTYGHDRSLSDPDASRIVRTGTLEPGILARGLRGLEREGGEPATGGSGGTTTAGQVAGAGARLKGLVQRLVHVPDSNVGWVPAAVKAGLREARDRRPDVILSSSPPLSAHLAAAITADRLRVPLVTDFRDYFDTQRLFPGRRERFDERFERYVLDRTRGLTSPYRGILEALGDLTDAPSLVVRNGFEEDDFAGPAPAVPDGPFRILHVGTTYCDRTSPRPFLDAVRSLVEDGADVRVRFVGQPDPLLGPAVREAGLEDRVEITGFLPHEAAIREMRTANALLMMLWARPGRVARGLVLGKTFEYLRSGRPILALGSPDGDTATLLRRLGGARFAEADETETIRAGLAEFLAGRLPRAADPDELSAYSRQAQAHRLGDWLRELLGSSR